MSTNVKSDVTDEASLPSAAASASSETTDATTTTGVPSIAPSAVTAFLDAIDAFAQSLGGSIVLPQPEAVKRMPRPRKNASSIVSTVADLSTRYKVASQSFPVSTMLARQQLAATLAPVGERIAAAQKLVGDLSLVAQSGAWEGAMVTYGLLKSESRGNSVLRQALAPVRDELRVKYTTAEGTKTLKKSRSAAATKKQAAQAGAASSGASTQEAPPVVVAAPATTTGTAHA